MLHKDYSKINDIVREKCPSERKNWDSKEDTPNILTSAMINLYKLDKSERAKHLAALNGVFLYYHTINIWVKKQESQQQKILGSVQRAQKINSDSVLATEHGPPDRHAVQPPSSDDKVDDDFMDTFESVSLIHFSFYC